MNKKRQAVIKMLIENSFKNTGTWKIIKKKHLALLTTKSASLTNYETIDLKNCFNAFATSNNELIEVTQDEEINDNATISNNAQNSQVEVKRRLNIGIRENFIRSQNIKTVGIEHMRVRPIMERKYILLATVTWAKVRHVSHFIELTIIGG